MQQESTIADKLLSIFTKATCNSSEVNPLITRFQSLAIILINLFFLTSMGLWKIIDYFFWELPGNETIILFVPIQVACVVSMKLGKRNLAACLLLMAIRVGNLSASRICNLHLGASYNVILFPGVSYFISSSKKLHVLNLILCCLQSVSHLQMVKRTFSVTFSEDQEFQILTLELIAILYIPMSWMLFALQKYIETHLWQLAHSNFTKAENINKELMEAVEAKDGVISSFSHEIRNALNSLNGCNEYLLKVVSDVRQVKMLKNAKLSGEVLLNLVNNVLDAAKLKSEKLELAYIESDPLDVLKKVLNINSELIAKKKLVTGIHLDKQIPSKLNIDPSRLLQVFMNVFSNALKFTNERDKITIYTQWCNEDTAKEDLIAPVTNPRGLSSYTANNRSMTSPLLKSRISPTSRVNASFSSEIAAEFEPEDFKKRSRNFSYLELPALPTVSSSEEISPYRQFFASNTEILELDKSNNKQLTYLRSQNREKKGYLKIEIADTGCGIPTESTSQLFTMFTRAKKRGQLENEGTGLGLWISKQLCQKMGGDIEVYSQDGLGTTVVFYIAADNDPLAIRNSDPARLNGDGKVRALVVDDYAYNRDVHKLILEREGVEVSLACNGKEAIEKYVFQGEGYFNFIMMDVQMPEMDGLTAAQEIRRFENERKRKNVDIYFVSGNYYSKNEALNSVNLIDKDSSLATTKFLRKPIDLGILKQIVEKFENVQE